MLRASDDGLHRKPHWRPSQMLCGCWRGRRASCQLTVQAPALRRAELVAITLATSKATMARLTDRGERRQAHCKAVASPATSLSAGLVPAFACKIGAAVQVMAMMDAGVRWPTLAMQHWRLTPMLTRLPQICC